MTNYEITLLNVLLNIGIYHPTRGILLIIPYILPRFRHFIFFFSSFFIPRSLGAGGLTRGGGGGIFFAAGNVNGLLKNNEDGFPIKRAPRHQFLMETYARSPRGLMIFRGSQFTILMTFF